jgi:outer membrane receptor protein involved in Fe transport
MIKRSNLNTLIGVYIFLFACIVQLYGNDSAVKRNIDEMTLKELLNIEVTVAGRKSQKRSEVPAIVSVITEEELADMGVQTLYEALSYIPGIDIKETYFGYTSVSFRGQKQTHYNNKSLLLINNHPVFDTTVGSYYLEQIPLNMIHRIEIIRGPGSTLYGTNAYAGVIKIITKMGSDQNGKGEIEIQGGSFSTIQTGIVYGQQYHNFQFSAAANLADSKGFDYNIATDEEARSGTIQYENDVSNGLLSMAYKSFQLNLGFFKQKKDKFGLIPTLTSTGERRVNGFIADLSYHFKLGKKMAMELSVFYDHMSKQETIEWYPPLEALKLLGIGEKEEQRYSGSKLSFQVQSSYEFNDITSLSSGITYEYQQVDPYVWYAYGTDTISPFGSSSYLDSNSVYNVSGYIQLDTRLFKKIGVVAGIRYNHNQDYGSQIAPRGGLVYAFSNKLSLKILYGKAFRNPSFFEKYVDAKNILYGNISLEPEAIDTLDIGLDILLNESNSMRLNFFHTTSNNLITRSLIVPVGEKGNTRPTPQYTNSEGETFNGFEIEFKGSVLKNIYYFANTSFVVGEEKTDQTDVAFIPRWLGAIGVTWKANKKLTMASYLQYTGKRKGFLANGDLSITPAYLIWNLNIKTKLSKYLSLQLIGKNLGNKNYYYPEYIRRNISQIPGGPPRSFYLKFLLSFN